MILPLQGEWEAAVGCQLKTVFWRALIACAMAITGCGASIGVEAAEAALKDPGFEGGTRQVDECPRVRGSLPLSWSDNSCWNSQADVQYEPVSSPSRAGKALKVTLKQGLFQLTQSVFLPLDSNLRAGVWMRSATPMVVKVALRQSGQPYLDYGARTWRVTDAWTWVEASTASHGLWDAEGRQALFMISSASPGTVWLDEASLDVKPASLALPSKPVPATYFGTHVHHAVNLRSAQVESGAGAVRIWDSAQSQWFQVEKRRPRGERHFYNWQALDERVALADQRGTDLLMVLGGYAPAWASLPEDVENEFAPDCWRCFESPSMRSWQTWVRDLVQRYKGRSLRAWEIWNEPNFPPKHAWCPDEASCRSGLGSGYLGTPEQLLELQSEAVRIIRNADPKAVLVSAGISHLHRDYLDYFLRIGGGRQVDAIGYHFYLEGPPELLMPHALAIRHLMRDDGVADKALWNTEGGVPNISLDIDPAVRYARSKGITPMTRNELGPAYLARFMVVGWASGIERFYQYSWDGQPAWSSAPTLINRNTNGTEGVTAAGQAYRLVRAWMSGRTLVRMETGQSNGLWRATLRDNQGREAQIVWHPGRPPDAPVRVTVPTAGRTCGIAGDCRDVAANSVLAVDCRPMYIGF